MSVSLRRIILPDDRDAILELLVANTWPFHAQRVHTAESAGAVEIESESVSSWWIYADDERVGLVRAIELDDIEEGGGGCPLFDIRLAEPARRRGIGTGAVALLTDELFER